MTEFPPLNRKRPCFVGYQLEDKSRTVQEFDVIDKVGERAFEDELNKFMMCLRAIADARKAGTWKPDKQEK